MYFMQENDPTMLSAYAKIMLADGRPLYLRVGSKELPQDPTIAIQLAIEDPNDMNNNIILYRNILPCDIARETLIDMYLSVYDFTNSGFIKTVCLERVNYSGKSYFLFLDFDVDKKMVLLRAVDVTNEDLSGAKSILSLLDIYESYDLRVGIRDFTRFVNSLVESILIPVHKYTYLLKNLKIL